MCQSELIVQHIAAEKWFQRSRWKLIEPLSISTYIVPRGFITDGVSTPLLIAWLVSPTGKAMRAAVLHDYLLSAVKRGESRRYADKCFFEAMLICNVSYFRATIMYTIVRLYGIAKVGQ